jgi:MATE family multidrug resistance protein
MGMMIDKPAVRRDLSELLTLAWPVILSRVAIMVMGLVDTIVVGHASATELGYLGVAWAPTAVAITTGIGLISGVQVMTARHIGEGRPEATGGVFRRGAIYAFWLGVAAGALLFAAGPGLLHSIGLDPSLATGAGTCLQILALGLPLQLMATAASFYLEALQRPKAPMLVMWVANGVNLALNLALVPSLGADGAAWATFGSRVLMFVGLVGLVFMQKDARTLGVFGKPVDSAADAREQRRVGYGGGAALFAETGGFAAMQIVAGWLGVAAAAGWAIVLNVAAVIFMIPLGLASATAVLVGRAYGARDRHALRRVGLLGFAVCAAALTLVAVGVLVAATPIARAYTADEALLLLVVPALQLCALFFVSDGLQVVGAQALRACGDVVVSTVVQIACYGLVVGPLAWALAIGVGWGFLGIVWAVIGVSLAAAFLQTWRFWSLSRI